MRVLHLLHYTPLGGVAKTTPATSSSRSKLVATRTSLSMTDQRSRDSSATAAGSTACPACWIGIGHADGSWPSARRRSWKKRAATWPTCIPWRTRSCPNSYSMLSPPSTSPTLTTPSVPAAHGSIDGLTRYVNYAARPTGDASSTPTCSSATPVGRQNCRDLYCGRKEFSGWARRADAIVCPSEYVRRQHIESGFPPERTHALHHLRPEPHEHDI